MTAWYTVDILAILMAVSAYQYLKKHSRQQLLPPGPRGIPFFGNALQIPLEQQWKALASWAKTYGDVMHLSVMGQSLIVLSSAEAITDLLEKRSILYCDRPQFPTAGDMCIHSKSRIGYAGYVVITPYGDRLRQSRKLFLDAVKTGITVLQESQALEFVSRLINAPDRLQSHLQWLMANTTFETMYGFRVENDDPMIRVVRQVEEDFSKATQPGAFMADRFPFLRRVPEWLPGGGFKKVVKEFRLRISVARDQPFDAVREAVMKGTASPSFVATLLEENSNRGQEEDDMYRCVATAFYISGAGTTISALETFFLMIALYPQVQNKAQLELDEYLELGCLPKLSDRSKLPYVNSLIQEVLRCGAVAPLALPHRVIQDDIYKGYYIPAGATVIPNSWAVLHDPSLYPEPFKFDPERYLMKEKHDNINPDPRTFAFGYGRRVCPGRLLAEDLMFMIITTVLTTLRISTTRVFDSSSPDSVKFVGGVIRRPDDFDCHITPRSPDLVAGATVRLDRAA